MDDRILSIIQGLIIPEPAAICIHSKVNAPTPSASEMQLLLAPHPDKKVSQMSNKLLTDLLDKTTEYETDLLKLYRLPAIDRVRASFQKAADPWEYDEMSEPALKRILDNWQTDLLGAKNSDNMSSSEKAILAFWLFSMFSYGLKKFYDLIQKSLPEWKDPNSFLPVVPTSADDYFTAASLAAAGRLREKIGKDYFKLLKSVLPEMAQREADAMEIARWLHLNVGEGQSWWWMRTVRSEMQLQLNASYDRMADAAGVPYDQWRAFAGCCQICAALDGQVWRHGEGPYPVSDTHPNCRCEREPVWSVTGIPVNSPWNRPSPYQVPWTPGEISALRP
jgi:hypothetical protein